MECARALGKAAFDLADDGSDLRNVVDLPVEHCAGLMLHMLGGENVEHAVPLLSDDADHAACADVEGKDEFGGALTVRCCMLCSRILLWAAALFHRSVLCLLLYAFFRTAAPFCRRIGSRCVFVQFIQIRHFVLPCNLCILSYLFEFF